MGCRIFGSFGPGMVLQDRYQTAKALLYAGGPDQQSHAVRVMARGGVRYVCRVHVNRLAISDPAGGDQPYKQGGDAADCVAVFNGEIYNHRQLRRWLGDKYDFVDDCDGRVILPAYFELDLDFATCFDGMFSIA